jgi:hypothetical protein
MKTSRFASALVGTVLIVAAGWSLVHAESPPVGKKALSGTYLNFLEARKAMAEGKPVTTARSAVIPVPSTGFQLLSAGALADSEGDGGGLPLFSFNARAARDGHRYRGTMIGSSPFTNPHSVSVPAFIVPVILHIHGIATAIDPNTGAITSVPGDFTVDPTARDNVCLAAPNNVPAKVLRQSPIFEPANFSFGGTSVGKTQYIDAFMRANFFGLRGVAHNYHLQFGPVNTLQAIEIDVPASEGVAIDSATFFGPHACGTLTFIDISWWDQLLNATLLPELAEEGVNASNLPVFFLYNTVLGGPLIGLGDCCIGGYHSLAGFPTPTATYSVADFDTTGLFGVAFANTAVIAHELGEWANDPYTINLVPPWGGTGQVSGCQGNLEVGDPLTGTIVPTVKQPNGFTYDLQELAFFSWFFGGPSIGINGWFSNNGTFTTDAGTPCLLQ